VAHLQAFEALEPLNPFMINSPTLPLQKRVDPPVAMAYPDGGNLLDPVSQGCLLRLAGPVIQGGGPGRVWAARRMLTW
jgi:hypothetical protein